MIPFITYGLNVSTMLSGSCYSVLNYVNLLFINSVTVNGISYNSTFL